MSKPTNKPTRPPLMEMIKLRLRREGKYEDFMAKYKFHKEFGMTHGPAIWQAARDVGYTSADEERRVYDEYTERGVEGYEQERNRKEAREKRLQSELQELQATSKDQTFDAVKGIEWVASVFHLEHVTPGECPHIIAWNVLQTSKKYEVAFFKDFLMKSLQKGITAETTEEFAEDEMQISELRREVKEAIGE